MSKKKNTRIKKGENKKRIIRKEEDLQLKNKLLAGPELYKTEPGSDQSLDRQLLKIKLLDGREFTIDDYVANEMTKYESKFFKDWFYRIADLYKVNRNVMDVYVKPDFVRLFIIQFVYARFPRLLLRTLRSRNRKLKKKNGKLYYHLKRDVSDMLDVIIGQIYTLLGNAADPLDFKKKYSDLYKVHYQTELF